MDENISKSVFFKTAREIWIDLEDCVGYVSMAQEFSLEQQLSDLHQGSKSVFEFFTEIKVVWNAISDVNPLPCCTCTKCSCNVSQKVNQMQKDQRLIQFMVKLSDKYATVRGDILMQHPLPSLSNAFHIFTQEERHLELLHLTNQTESLAYMANNKMTSYDNGPPKNFRTGAHNFRNGIHGMVKVMDRTIQRNVLITFALIVIFLRHNNERCFQFQGYPPNFKFKDKKIAAVSVNNSGDPYNLISSSAEGSPQISLAQYNQLMELLNKQQ